MQLDKNLLKGSIMLLVGFGLYNFFNFLFQFVMARMLTISDYGVLATIFSMFYMLTVFIEGTQTVIAKVASTNKDDGSLKNILRRSFKKSIKIACWLFVAYTVISFFILRHALKIDYGLLILSGIAIFTSLTLPINRGLMQGRKRFFALSTNLIIESVVKLVLGIVFVTAGFAVYGAVAGTLLGAFVALAFSFTAFKDVSGSKESNAETKQIYSYSVPTFFITAVIIAFYSVDVLIARFLFSPEVAGEYAIASVLAKIVFWGTQPISRAMFPISAENNHKDPEKKSHILLNACIFLGLLLIIAIFLFYFFSPHLVSLFSGKNIPGSVEIVVYLVIGMAALSFTNLFLLYKLSVHRIKGYMITALFLAVEIAILFIFSNNLMEYSIGFMVASFILLVGSLLSVK